MYKCKNILKAEANSDKIYSIALVNKQKMLK